MVFGLIAAFVVLAVGITLLVLASRIGGWLANARIAYRREMREIRGEDCKSCVSSWNKTALRFGRAFDTWLVRVIGIVFVAGAIYLLFTTIK